MATCLDCKYFSDKYRADNGNKVDCCCRLYNATGLIIPINRNAPCFNKIQRDYSVGIDLANSSNFTSEGNAKTVNKTEGESVETVKISELLVDYVSFDDDDKEISGIAISYKDKNNQEQRRWLEKPRRIGHWENMEIAKNTIRCSNCGHLRELKHFSEIIKRPKLCEMCGAVMDESEEKQ